MNPTIVVATLRQRFTSPMRLVLCGMIGWFPMLAVLASPAAGFALLGDGAMLALVLGAGMIGQDVSSGTLPLLLARPVSRASYVLSRWSGVALGAWLLVLLQALTAAFLMMARGAAVPWDGAAVFLANGALGALGMAAVMALLSSLLDGLGDLGLYLVLTLTAQTIQLVGRMRSSDVLARVGEELARALTPKLSVVPFFGPPPVSWFELVSYVSTVTLCLALAIVVVNRRELSYASTGA